MTVRAGSNAIELVGQCPSQDAEPLLQLLLADPDAAIDWRACDQAHTAVVQLMLAAGRPVVGPPKDAFLAQWAQPVFRRN